MILAPDDIRPISIHVDLRCEYPSFMLESAMIQLFWFVLLSGKLFADANGGVWRTGGEHKQRDR